MSGTQEFTSRTCSQVMLVLFVQEMHLRTTDLKSCSGVVLAKIFVHIHYFESVCMTLETVIYLIVK